MGRGGVARGGFARGATARAGMPAGIRSSAMRGVRSGSATLPEGVGPLVYSRAGAPILLRSSTGATVRGFVRITRMGHIEAFHSNWASFRTVGRIYSNGELWQVNPAGSPLRLVARIRSDGTIWEVNSSGFATSFLGTLRAIVSRPLINVRFGPGRGFELVGHLRRGDLVNVIGYENGYYKIARPDGISAWIAASKSEATLDYESRASNANVLRSFSPSGQIQSIWVEHNQFEDGRKGMRIHARFSIQNSFQVQCLLGVYFYYTNNWPLKNRDQFYGTNEGQVAHHRTFTPAYDDTTYEDFTLFIPYDEFHIDSGTHQLKFQLKLYRADVGFLADSTFQTFSFWR